MKSAYLAILAFLLNQSTSSLFAAIPCPKLVAQLAQISDRISQISVHELTNSSSSSLAQEFANMLLEPELQIATDRWVTENLKGKKVSLTNEQLALVVAAKNGIDQFDLLNAVSGARHVPTLVEEDLTTYKKQGQYFELLADIYFLKFLDILATDGIESSSSDQETYYRQAKQNYESAENIFSTYGDFATERRRNTAKLDALKLKFNNRSLSVATNDLLRGHDDLFRAHQAKKATSVIEMTKSIDQEAIDFVRVVFEKNRIGLWMPVGQVLLALLWRVEALIQNRDFPSAYKTLAIYESCKAFIEADWWFEEGTAVVVSETEKRLWIKLPEMQVTDSILLDAKQSQNWVLLYLIADIAFKNGNLEFSNRALTAAKDIVKSLPSDNPSRDDRFLGIVSKMRYLELDLTNSSSISHSRLGGVTKGFFPN